MNHGSKAADDEVADHVVPLDNWREYAAIPRFGDYDGLVGDELSVPILYDPA